MATANETEALETTAEAPAATNGAKLTKSQEVAADVSALLRARNPLLWIVTREEARVERYLIQAAGKANYMPRMWDVSQGFTKLDGKKDTSLGDSQDIAAAFSIIEARARNENNARKERGVWIMRDVMPWITGFPGASPLRQLRNLSKFLPGVGRETAQAIVVVSSSGDLPPDLMGHATVIEWPIPDREEVAAVLDVAIKKLPVDLQTTAAPNGTRDAAIDAALGLSEAEAAACYAKSLVQYRKIDPTAVGKEKKRVVARERVLEWYDPIPDGLDAVGGLENMKAWLLSRKLAYTPAARAYGLQAPKGSLLVGISGCGKSLTAKAVATAFGVPLLKLDLGAIKSKYVGDSEANLRKAFRTIEAIGRCVVWLDEVEKALQGATSGAADGGVSADALGATLQWMQERQGEAFIIATANDISSLPPEFLRKGRFDETWWIDLPTFDERQAIMAAALRAHKRDAVKLSIDLTDIAMATKDFTGSEIAALVPEAMFVAFADGGREPTTADLVAVASKTVPLSETAKEKINRLREWAKTRARPATAAPEAVSQDSGPTLDI